MASTRSPTGSPRLYAFELHLAGEFTIEINPSGYREADELDDETITDLPRWRVHYPQCSAWFEPSNYPPF
jgi:hypothetical protein